ncbi:Holliday junction branch migration protein RuvA [Parabacteroides sp. FAFU027]|uniref:Holliday junction branch migration protein RuvA n=1 Tax=Parabacteroides sp. FAFU027 TaxID=2922715 RepID=UPI001FAFB15F|nr:Holliday junction branch migration protein RuvA [Parabacteroides sp. FAFU027]
MLDYISGEIVELTPASVVVDCNGLGYFINISLNTYQNMSVGHRIKLYVYEAIREDAHLLYGFRDKHEREIFLLLISVSGVGTNTARVILSSMTVAELESTIASGNSKLLKTVKGIGAKTAERIIVDLKDKIKASGDSLIMGALAHSETENEAVAALIMLGFMQAASAKVVRKLLSESPQMTVEQVIKSALKLL